MRRIPDIYAAGREARRPVISVEFFPPKTPEGEARLFGRVLPALAAVRPDFYSVTCGAGGSGVRERTLQIVDKDIRDFRADCLYGFSFGVNSKKPCYRVAFFPAFQRDRGGTISCSLERNKNLTGMRPMRRQSSCKTS